MRVKGCTHVLRARGPRAGIHGPGYGRLTFAILCAILQTSLRAAVVFSFLDGSAGDMVGPAAVIRSLVTDIPGIVMFFEAAYIGVHGARPAAHACARTQLRYRSRAHASGAALHRVAFHKDS